MVSRDEQAKYDQFRSEIANLRGNALLDRKIAFDDLPEPINGEGQLRLMQQVCLKAALEAEYGLGQWPKRLDERRVALAA